MAKDLQKFTGPKMYFVLLCVISDSFTGPTEFLPDLAKGFSSFT